MAATKNVESSSSIFEMKFPAFPEISKPTRIALAALSALSMAASLYGVVRKMDATTFSIGALTTAQKVASGAFFALGLLFAASAALCQGSKAEKVKGAKPLPEIPFKDQLPPWFMSAIEKSKRPYRFVSFDKDAPGSEDFKDFPESIVFFTVKTSNLLGIYLKLQATNSVDSEKLNAKVWGILHKEDNSGTNSWALYKGDGLGLVLRDRQEFSTEWNPASFVNSPEPGGVFDLDAFEQANAEGLSLDGMLGGLLSLGCRINDKSSGRDNVYWSLSLAENPSASSSSSDQR